MNCLSLSVISWESFFSRFSSDWEALYRLLMGYGNVESTIIEGGGLREFVKGGKSLMYF